MTAISTPDDVDVGNDRSSPQSQLGEIPVIALCAGIGLLLCSVADALSRATLAPSPVIYWAGILIIGLPVFHRLGSREASSRERLTLVCLLGISLYLVRLAHGSFTYLLPDEFIHAYNAEQIIEHDHLFHANPTLPITPDYPGLEGATSALMALTGMTSFGAGVLVIGAARLVLVIGLYLLLQRVSGSARVAGIGSAVYTGSSNFLLWGAQYSYQSLALPLFVMVLWAVAEREGSPRSWARAWAVPIVLLTTSVIVTHHLTSYLLAVALILLSLLYWLLRRDWSWPSPWQYAVLATGLVGVWLAVTGFSAIDYLSPTVDRAFNSAVNTFTGSSRARALFEGSASNPGRPAPPSATTPALARVIALGAVALLAAALPFGLIQVWRRYRRKPFALLFCGGALGFFGVLALRFAPEAWETSNRAGEFLFIGLAFVVAFAFLLAYPVLEDKGPEWAPWLGRGTLTGCLGVLLIGGAISGWAWDSQLARPVQAVEDGRTIDSEPLAMSKWVRDHLPDERFATQVADSRFLLYPAGAVAFSGRHPDIEGSLNSTDFLKGGGCTRNCQVPASRSYQLEVLRDRGLSYVIPDRLLRSGDNVRGYYFSVQPPGGDFDSLLPEQSALKFEQIPTAARIFDSGNITIYNLEAGR